MKYTFLLIFLVVINFITNAQIINLNPDPNGEPWIVGDLPEVNADIRAELDAIPEMVLSTISSTMELPEVVDNSQNNYMRPIFNQSGACMSSKQFAQV